MTKPVLIQSFEDEFSLEEITGECATPVAPGSTFEETEQVLDEKRHTNFRKGVGKLIHVTKYSRPMILNAVQELTRYGGNLNAAHEKAMLRCMKHCVKTKR